jgi:CBS domain-containing protein
MSIGTLCIRSVDTAKPDETAWQAAVRMRQRAVGALVVVNDLSQPIGILTDRDLMERVVADGCDAQQTLVQEIMTANPTTAAAAESLRAAVSRMRCGKFRRLPVVDSEGTLVGLVSLDDVLILIGQEMAQIAELVKQETPQGIAQEPVQSRWE